MTELEAFNEWLLPYFEENHFNCEDVAQEYLWDAWQACAERKNAEIAVLRKLIKE